MNRELRRMNLAGQSPAQRAQVRRIMVEALSKVCACSRPELAAEYSDTIDIIDELDGESS